MDFCCLHLGGGHVGSNTNQNDVGETVVRKEKANLDLCCCGFKMNEADQVKHSHPATQPAATTAGAAPGSVATKPTSNAPPQQAQAYNPAPPAGYGQVNTAQQPPVSAPPTGAPAQGSTPTTAQTGTAQTKPVKEGYEPVMGYPNVSK
ncbi:g3096 [Coccomyxa viridis]|uniref:G3096 protein n=1 Tax=Coccomyxa viridis TaxID=1274662 RepID=A0ABP1FQH3_9CHLO